MSFHYREYLLNLGNQVKKANPNAPIQYGRGILVICANKAFTNMGSERVVVHYENNMMHAICENDRVAVEGTGISSETDEQSLQVFSQELGKLVGFHFTS